MTKLKLLKNIATSGTWWWFGGIFALYGYGVNFHILLIICLRFKMKFYRDVLWATPYHIPSTPLRLKNMATSGQGIFALYGYSANFENLRVSLRDFIEILKGYSLGDPI